MRYDYLDNVVYQNPVILCSLQFLFLLFNLNFFLNGVKITSIQRDHDVFIQSQLEDKYVDFGFANGQARSLIELEGVFNVSEENISTEIDRFFDSWQQLSSNPGDPVLRDVVIHRGNLLASGFNSLANNLNGVVHNINDAIQSKVDGLNGVFEEIAELNDRIYNIEIQGQMANSDRDRRDMLVKDLAEKLGTTTYLDKSGMVNVQLPGGLPIVQGNMPMRLETVTNGSNVDLQLHTGGTVRNMSTHTLGGEMLGMFTMRDEFIPSIMEDVDRLAWEVGNQVNLQHTAGASIDGTPATEFFLDTTAVSPPALSMYENAARNMAVFIDNADNVAAGLPGAAAGRAARSAAFRPGSAGPPERPRPRRRRASRESHRRSSPASGPDCCGGHRPLRAYRPAPARATRARARATRVRSALVRSTGRRLA